MQFLLQNLRITWFYYDYCFNVTKDKKYRTWIFNIYIFFSRQKRQSEMSYFENPLLQSHCRWFWGDFMSQNLISRCPFAFVWLFALSFSSLLCVPFTTAFSGIFMIIVLLYSLIVYVYRFFYRFLSMNNTSLSSDTFNISFRSIVLMYLSFKFPLLYSSAGTILRIFLMKRLSSIKFEFIYWASYIAGIRNEKAIARFSMWVFNVQRSWWIERCLAFIVK